MKIPSSQSGFSAIELLITLFIAFIFVMMGYQLYVVTVKDGADANVEATLSTYAQKNMRQVIHGTDETSVLTCAALQQPPHNGSYTGGYTIDGITLAVTLTCPRPTDLPNLQKVVSTVTYQGRQMTHASYFHF